MNYRFKRKRKLDKNVTYVLPEGNRPGVYEYYEDALKYSYPWDADGKKIRVFKTREEAENFYWHKKEPPIVQKPLFTDDDLKGSGNNSTENQEDPYTDL